MKRTMILYRKKTCGTIVYYSIFLLEVAHEHAVFKIKYNENH